MSKLKTNLTVSIPSTTDVENLVDLKTVYDTKDNVLVEMRVLKSLVSLKDLKEAIVVLEKFLEERKSTFVHEVGYEHTITLEKV